MNKNILEKILDVIIAVIKIFIDKSESSTTKPISSSDSHSLKILTKNLSEELPEEVKKVAISEGVGLLVKYNDVILKMSPIQKEYAINVAYLKSIENLDKLSLSELQQLADVNAKAIELGIKVTNELNEFWTSFGNSVKKIIGVATDISAKAAGIALKTLIL